MANKNIISVKKRPTVYAFIDSQNLNLGTRKDITRHGKKIYDGWKLDYQKFRIHLADKFRVTEAFLFIGYIKENQALYDQLCSFGYQLVFKPTTKDSLGKPKGNIDAELVLHAAAIEFKKYHQAVIVSGDGDFRCLHEFLLLHNKLAGIVIPNRYNESSLLKKFHEYKYFVNQDKEKLKRDTSR